VTGCKPENLYKIRMLILCSVSSSKWANGTRLTSPSLGFHEFRSPLRFWLQQIGCREMEPHARLLDLKRLPSSTFYDQSGPGTTATIYMASVPPTARETSLVHLLVPTLGMLTLCGASSMGFGGLTEVTVFFLMRFDPGLLQSNGNRTEALPHPQRWSDYDGCAWLPNVIDVPE
jgi:hypothetical protein